MAFCLVNLWSMGMNFNANLLVLKRVIFSI